MTERIAREYTPADAVVATVREKVVIGPKFLHIERPANADVLIDHPAVRSAFTADEYLPHWTDIWPGARMLAKSIVAETWPAGLQALELGCGLGVAGVAALSCGLRVIFSDYDTTACQFAARNARLNRFSDFELRPFDWRNPPLDLSVSLVLASDLTYEARNHEPLFATLDAVLTPDGEAWLTDPDRKQSPAFFDILRARGWVYSRKVVHAGAPGQERERGTLYRIRRGPETAQRNKKRG